MADGVYKHNNIMYTWSSMFVSELVNKFWKFLEFWSLKLGIHLSYSFFGQPFGRDIQYTLHCITSSNVWVLWEIITYWRLSPYPGIINETYSIRVSPTYSTHTVEVKDFLPLVNHKLIEVCTRA